MKEEEEKRLGDEEEVNGCGREEKSGKKLDKV